MSVERAADAMVESRLDDWLCRVKELRRLCTLPAAVLALHALADALRRSPTAAAP